MDVSADLQEVCKTPVAVVCAGVKCGCSPLLTLEYLETMGVTVLGCGTDRFRVFTQDGPALENPPQSALQLARTARIKWDGGCPAVFCTAPGRTVRRDWSRKRMSRPSAGPWTRPTAWVSAGGARTPFLLQKILESSEAARGAYEKGGARQCAAGAEIAVKYAQL